MSVVTDPGFCADAGGTVAEPSFLTLSRLIICADAMENVSDPSFVTLHDPTFCADAGGNAARPPLSGRRRRGGPSAPMWTSVGADVDLRR